MTRRITLLLAVIITATALWKGRWAAEWLYLIGINAEGTVSMPSRDSLSVPVRLVRNLIVVPSSLNGRAANLVLDTGLQFTVLNADRVGELGIELHGSRKVPSSGTSISVSFGSVSDISIAALTFRPKRLAAIPLGFLEPVVGEPIHGILGHDLLEAVTTRINYREGRLTFLPESLPPPTSETAVLPLRIDSREAFVDVFLRSVSGDSVRVPLKLDTGSPATLGLAGGLVRDRRLLVDSQARRDVPGIGLGGETTGQAFLVQQIRLGPFAFDSVLAHSNPADSSTGGVIGAEVLRQFTITFDYRSRKLWLKPNDSLPKSLAYDRSGVTLHSFGARFDSLRVHFVETGSASATAGLLEGDVIIAVDEVPVDSLRLSGVVDRLTRPNARVRLALARAGKPITMELELK